MLRLKNLFLIFLILQSNLIFSADKPEKENLRPVKNIVKVIKTILPYIPVTIAFVLLLKTAQEKNELIAEQNRQLRIHNYHLNDIASELDRRPSLPY